MLPIVEQDPQSYARSAGALYLALIAVGFYGVIAVQGRLVVSDNAAATAARIAASEHLWRVGICCDLFTHLCDVPLMLILYLLLRPVSRWLAQLALLFTLVQTAVLVACELTLLVPLFVLTDPAARAFAPAQQQALTAVFLDAQAYGFGVGLVFFGCACLISGYLIRHSSYLPRIIGALIQVAGVCYLTNSAALLLAPATAAVLFPGVLVPAFLAEFSFALWLLVKGVNVAAWHARLQLADTGS